MQIMLENSSGLGHEGLVGYAEDSEEPFKGFKQKNDIIKIIF